MARARFNGAQVTAMARKLALAVLPLAALVCVVPAAAQELSPAECVLGSEVRAVWRGNVTCYELTVPESRGDPQTRFLDLAVYEIKSHLPEPGAPVVYLAGGPGMAAPYYVNLLLRHPLRDHRPIIVLEQRGVGASGELCPSLRRNYYRRVASRQSNDLRRRQFIGLILSCFDDVRDEGGNLDAYTTDESAADLADLRIALGLERMDLWAVSYGTILAQAYIRREPAHVGAIVMDGAVPADYAIETRLYANFIDVLNRLWDACRTEGTCGGEEPDFVTRLRGIIPDYDERPLRLLGYSPEPSIVVTYVYVTGVDAAGIIFSLLYERPTAEAVDRVLTLLERRSSSFLRAHFQRLATPGFSYGLHFAVNCRGPLPSAEDLDALRVRDPEFFEAMQVGFQQELCVNSELAPEAPVTNAPFTHLGRILVMSGALDPITPLSIAEPLRGRFPNASFVEVPQAGHGPSRSDPCSQQMVTAYFTGGDDSFEDMCGNSTGP